MVIIRIPFGSLNPAVFAQDVSQSIPDAVRRPERGEAPRYPIDMVIGNLGQGSASYGAYIYARNILSSLTGSNVSAIDSVLSGHGTLIREEIVSLRPRNYRIGGGRTESDGSTSFLIRLLSQNESITGELFIRQNENNEWFMDAIILEERRLISEIRDSFRYDFSPYERFY